MKYYSVADTAKLWNISERTVRNYCAAGKIPGAVLTGKTWNIPQDAKRPARTNKKPEAPRTLLDILQNEMTGQVKGGIYHKIQIDLTFDFGFDVVDAGQVGSGIVQTPHSFFFTHPELGNTSGFFK